MADARKYNKSGCPDPTAFEAIERASKTDDAERRYKKLIATVFYLCDLAGFHLEERIVLKDKKTGKVWR